MNSLPKTVTGQRRGCDLNPGPSAPESSTLTTRPTSHPIRYDTILDAISTCAEKLTQVSLIYRTEPTSKKGKKEELDTKNG